MFQSEVNIDVCPVFSEEVPLNKLQVMSLTNQLPTLKEQIENKELTVDIIDVFCEKGVFDVDQSRRILQAGKDIGLAIKLPWR